MGLVYLANVRGQYNFVLEDAKEGHSWFCRIDPF